METRISAGKFREEEEIRMAKDLLQVQETVSVPVRLAYQVNGLIPGPVWVLGVKELNHFSPGQKIIFENETSRLSTIIKRSLVRDTVLVLVQDPLELVLSQGLVSLVQLSVGVTDVLCQCQLPVPVSIMLLHHLLE